MKTILGMQIHASAAIPDTTSNFHLTPGDYIGPEFRARMQAWCDEFFGVSPFFLIVQGKSIVASPHNINSLREKLEKMYPSYPTSTD